MQPDPKAIDEIAYAAFQTHFNSSNAQTKTGHTAEAYWNGVATTRTLWRGIVKGVITNVVVAQTEGRVPQILLASEVPAGLLPGLGGPSLPIPARPGPADVARRLSQHAQAKAHEAAAAGDPREAAEKAAREVAPGLAIGRCTEGPCDDPPEGEHRAVLNALEGKSDDGDEG